MYTRVKCESVVCQCMCVCAQVRSRPDGMVNAGQSTGGVEVVVETATLLNSCGALPFQVCVHTRVFPVCT